MIPNSLPEQFAELFWSDESNYYDIHGPSTWEKKKKIIRNFHICAVSLVHEIFYS